MKTQLTSKQIESITGLKANTLHYYVQAGAVTPDIDGGDGRGTRRLFSGTNLVEVVIINRLIEMGVAKQRILECLKGIREAGDREKLAPEKIQHPFSGFLVFAWDGSGQIKHKFIGYADREKALSELWKSGICSIVVNLNAIFAEYVVRGRELLFRVE
ncbi:MAG: MerR family transcriptional regulator [Desulfobacterales bacterium]